MRTERYKLVGIFINVKPKMVCRTHYSKSERQSIMALPAQCGNCVAFSRKSVRPCVNKETKTMFNATQLTENASIRLTLNAGTQIVSGRRRTYQPAQKNATGKATMIRMTSQMMNHSGFPILQKTIYNVFKLVFMYLTNTYNAHDIKPI